jgi:hypothetical protein
MVDGSKLTDLDALPTDSATTDKVYIVRAGASYYALISQLAFLPKISGGFTVSYPALVANDTLAFLGMPNAFTSTTEATAVGSAAITIAGGLGVAKRSFLGTIGATFKGNVLAGVQDATAAVSGQVGETLTGAQSTPTNYTTTATYQQIATVSLTPGDWEITATITLIANGATLTATANAIGVIGGTTASAAGVTEGSGDIGYISQVINNTSGMQTITLSKRVTISSTTSYFLNSQATFSAGNPQFVGSITARRMR